MNYFISDLHIGHTNCLTFDNRPFDNIEEHDGYIMEQWNKTVGMDDDVYILGDISWRNNTQTFAYFAALNGRKHLIKGNHDTKYVNSPDVRKLFVEIVDYKELFIDKHLSLVLSHFPLASFKNSHRGWIHLYGHVHNSFETRIIEHHRRLMRELYFTTYRDNSGHQADGFASFNVGCIMPGMDYTPRTLDEIKVLIDEERNSTKLLTCDEKYRDFVNKLGMMVEPTDQYHMKQNADIEQLND